ncbi:hypothetical protein KM043_005271 [Ampulex compressa]|nr:hypothetical protein KM043_005271 [Ampulex compressa]
MIAFVSSSLSVLVVHSILPLIMVANGYNPGYSNLYGSKPFEISEHVVRLRIEAIKVELGKMQQAYQNMAQPDMTPRDQASYDFIIVGGGTAGAALASRLSDIAASILLIEAGDEETPFMDVPLEAINSEKGNTKEYLSEPTDRYCLSMTNRQCRVKKARVMGGSSVTNWMVATRGHRDDYDEWARMGNTGWSYKEVLPYFRKLENMNIPSIRLDRTYHRRKGPMEISYSPFQTPLSIAFLRSMEDLGYPRVDYNGRDMVGFSRVQATMLDGSRISSNKAYLYSESRQNLFVSKNSIVKKVLINKKTKEATGVRFTKNEKVFTVYARKEVILCAGAIGSAQLLMLSGVGPTEDLKKLDIDVIQDLPVGYSLQDHVAFIGSTYVVKEPIGILFSDLDNLSYPYSADYYMYRKGPLTVPGGAEVIGFVNVDDVYNTQTLPNIEYLFFPLTIYNLRETMRDLGVNENLLFAFEDIKRNYTYSILTMLAKPGSRGRLRLKANDINVAPLIDPNYLATQEDIRILTKGVENAITFTKLSLLKQFGAELYQTPLPNCAQYTFNSPTYLHCAINHMTLGMGHYTGTCRMGPEKDYTAVVNPQLQVYGIEKLRVIDGSIMPVIPRGHLTLPTLMIAEKGADMIKERWGYPVDPHR